MSAEGAEVSFRRPQHRLRTETSLAGIELGTVGVKPQGGVFVPAKFLVSRSDATIEAGYFQPQFGLFRDEGGFLARLLTQLSPHGLKLSDVKIERGNGTLSDLHLLCYLFEYLLTIRVRVDRVEIYCSHLTEDNKKAVTAASLDTLTCIREHIGREYRAYALSMNIHGPLEGLPARTLLARLVTTPPADIGLVTGNAVAYYLGALEERIAGSLTLDVSAIAPDGLFARPQATWDASRMPLEQFAERAETFVRRTLASFGIEIP